MPTNLNLSTDQAATQITRHGYSWSYYDPFHPYVTTPMTVPINFGFRTTGDVPNFSEFDTHQIDTATEALNLWSDVANISFQRIGAGDVGPGAYSDDATILFGNYSQEGDGVAGYSNPDGSEPNPWAGDSDNSAGDVYINVAANGEAF